MNWICAFTIHILNLWIGCVFTNRALDLQIKFAYLWNVFLIYELDFCINESHFEFTNWMGFCIAFWTYELNFCINESHFQFMNCICVFTNWICVFTNQVLNVRIAFVFINRVLNLQVGFVYLRITFWNYRLDLCFSIVLWIYESDVYLWIVFKFIN